MSRINRLFKDKRDGILSIYFTAGYPESVNTVEIIKVLDEAGTDIIEIGMPFSDPVADGPVIQASNSKALANNMSISVLLEQLKGIRTITDVPLVLMGYFNPIYQYGIAEFCNDASACGVDGLIIPDLPTREYVLNYKKIFERSNLKMIFLITPQTTDDRIREIDELSDGYIYLVTSFGVTGRQLTFDDRHLEFLTKVAALKLKNPLLAGFGIFNKEGFDTVCQYVNGAIIGSSFIKALDNPGTLSNNIQQFIQSLTA